MAGGNSERKSTLRSHATSEGDLEQIVESALSKQAESFEKMLNLQAETFKKCMQCYIECTNTRLDTFMKETTKDICDLRTSLEFTQKEVFDLKSIASSSASDVSKLNHDLDAVSKTVQSLEKATD